MFFLPGAPWVGPTPSHQELLPLNTSLVPAALARLFGISGMDNSAMSSRPSTSYGQGRPPTTEFSNPPYGTGQAFKLGSQNPKNPPSSFQYSEIQQRVQCPQEESQPNYLSLPAFPSNPPAIHNSVADIQSFPFYPSNQPNQPSHPYYPGHMFMNLPPGFGFPGYNYGAPPFQQGHATCSQSTGGAPQPSSTQMTGDTDRDDDPRALKRPRLVWTPQLHKKFEEAVRMIGQEKAVPKTIMQEMNVEGLTRENVASHLQKYRMQQGKKESGSGSEDLIRNDDVQSYGNSSKSQHGDGDGEEVSEHA